MGLNDLTLEKLIGEINGYKEKMRSIYEEYGRASQELQDRINVLGYNLNEHLKVTKDQIASTPQRLLTLETKYVSGEVNEIEYRNQREEFKGLLGRNLQSIEEIKSMITVLSTIEARPLNAAEFKRAVAGTTAPTRTVTGEDWGRGILVQNAPSPSTPTPSSPLQTLAAEQAHVESPEVVAPIPAEDSQLVSSPAPTQFQSLGSSWFNTNPAPVEAPETPLPAPVETLPVELAPAPETPVIPVAPETTIAPAPLEIAPIAPEAVAPSVAVEAVTGSTDIAETPVAVDVVEAPTPDDALMVKVVEDVPTLDASAAVVTEDSSPIQASIPGTEAPTGLPSAPGIAQESVTLPTQFYSVVCPKCGADVPKPAKVWELKGGKSKKNVLIGLFQCQDCRVKFREALSREII